MQGRTFDFIRCPPQRFAEALTLTLSDLAPSQRHDLAGSLATLDDRADLLREPLFVAMRDETIVAAAWGQRESGRIALFWPPRFATDEHFDTSCRLAELVVRDLDDTAVELTQVIVTRDDESVVPVLTHVGFRQLAELLYLTCESERFPRNEPATDLEFFPYSSAQRERLVHLIKRSYDGTLDCVGLNGVRDVENVVTGYQATGVYRPDNWKIVRSNGQDVGILLMADHPKARHWELMYMGLTPDVRGRGLGRQIAQYAQWMAGRAGVERVVLAVDSVNEPAVRMYRTTGFEMWDRRLVYVRFPRQKHA
jgi:ribosomal protein S18 acetylase RimI-like enzyme